MIDGGTVGDVLANASSKFGEEFQSMIPICRVWVNGEAADSDTEVRNGDEVALLPPVSGG
ncbi:MAG: molybdopterin converting factor small subunit [Verrucomicrobiales bacterium]